jgi:hypothetical protein
MQSWKNLVFLFEAQLRKYKYRQFKNTFNERSMDNNLTKVFFTNFTKKNIVLFPTCLISLLLNDLTFWKLFQKIIVLNMFQCFITCFQNDLTIWKWFKK